MGEALLGAIIGGFIAIVADFTVARRGERRAHLASLTFVELELQAALADANDRTDQGDTLRRDPPYSTAAWEAAGATLRLERTSEEALRAIISAYDALRSANFLNEQAHSLYMISQTAEPEARELFHAEAIRIAKVGNGLAAAVLPATLDEVSKALADFHKGWAGIITR